MEKYETFKPDEETIEAWLSGFEVRLLCHNIQAAEKKRNWCQALVGESWTQHYPKAAPKSHLARNKVRAMCCSG